MQARTEWDRLRGADIKMITLDLDGTLLTSDKRITDRTMTALKAASDRGIHIVPTTGRIFMGLPQSVRAWPFLKYAILSNGASVYDVERDSAVYSAEIPLKQGLEIMTWLDGQPVIYDCYVDGGSWITAEMLERVDQYVANPVFVSYIKSICRPVPDLKAFVREKGRDIQKIQLFCRDDATQAELLRHIPFSRVAVSSSVPRNVEINHEDAHKGAGMLALARYAGIEPRQIMAFGDGLNDVSMIREAGIGVAMANAVDEVMRAASLVTDDNDSDGVAKAIEAYLYIKDFGR